MNLAIGFFDGLHRGHQLILGAADAVLTFREHPLSVIRPERAPVLLMSVEERLAALADGGRRKVVALDFTPALAAEEPDVFLARLRNLYPQIDQVFCGANWRFGHGGKGDAQFLRATGMACETMPYMMWKGKPVSSTRIRAALAEGKVDDATAMLGRCYTVTGVIRKGKGDGRKMGFPTINIDPERPLVLRRGVWSVDTSLGPAIANWGYAPTAGKKAWVNPILEVHLLQPPAENIPMVGKTMTVTLRGFIRDEREFPSYAALATQITADLLVAKGHFEKT